MPAHTPVQQRAKVLIIGTGNELMSDEGVGVAVARALMKEELPAGVQIVDAGCAPLDVLAGAGDYRRLIIVDAVRAGGAPGDVYRIEWGEMKDAVKKRWSFTSAHGIDLPASIAMTELAGTTLPPITIIGVEPGKVEFGADLSDVLKLRLPRIVDLVKGELALHQEDGGDCTSS